MVQNLSLPQPAAVGDEWGNALNAAVQAVNADVETTKGRTVSAGTGLTGGGDLTANRSLAIDFAADGAATADKAVRANDSRLTLIDTLKANKRLGPTQNGTVSDWDTALESGWYHAPANTPNAPNAAQYVAEVIAHSANYVVQTAYQFAASGFRDGTESGWRRVRLVGVWGAWQRLRTAEGDLDSRYALGARTITAGNGLTGGGDLTANRTLAVDLASAAPLADALAAVVGNSNKPARENHVHPTPAWQAYTPTWGAATTAPTLGNGTLTGRYFRYGNLVIGRVALKIGSTTGLGAGTWTFSLPVTVGGGAHMGTGLALDVGQRYWPIALVLQTTTTFSMMTFDGMQNVTPTTPYTFTTNDEVHATFMYEAA